MLSGLTHQKIQGILTKISKGEQITLEERIYVDQHADKNQEISSKLKRARRQQQGESFSDPIDLLLNNLDLGTADPESNYIPGEDDIGEWFSGAPSWLGRS